MAHTNEEIINAVKEELLFCHKDSSDTFTKDDYFFIGIITSALNKLESKRNKTSYSCTTCCWFTSEAQREPCISCDHYSNYKSIKR